MNPSNYTVRISPGEKIVQFVAYFSPNMTRSKEYTNKQDMYDGIESVRGEGGFGSSGIK